MNNGIGCDKIQDRMFKNECNLKASNSRNALGKLSNIISRRIEIANNENLSFAILAHSDAEIFRIFPNHLRKMASSRRSWLNAERMLFYLIIPSINGILSVYIVVGVGTVIENA